MTVRRSVRFDANLTATFGVTVRLLSLSVFIPTGQKVMCDA